MKLSKVLLLTIFLTMATVTMAKNSSKEPAILPNKHLPAGFVLSEAMVALYGNFDKSTLISTSDIPPDHPKNSFFDRADKISARVFYVRATRDTGVEKVFLLTYAVPTDEDFGCHACVPLIGAAAFKKVNGSWQIESSNRGATLAGQWGQPPPDTHLRRIGRERVGIELKNEFQGGGETSARVSILVPWETGIAEGLSTEIEDDDHGACGAGTLPCYKNFTKIKYVRGENPDYFDIVLTTTGTVLDEKKRPLSTSRISQIERRHVVNGKYEVMEP